SGEEVAILEHIVGHKRHRAGSSLDQYEAQERDGGKCEEADDYRVGPAQVDPFIEREEEAEETGGEKSDPTVVHAVVGERPLIRGDDAPGNEHGERSDREVQEKDPAPTDRIGQGASNKGADRVAETGRTQ